MNKYGLLKKMICIVIIIFIVITMGIYLESFSFKETLINPLTNSTYTVDLPLTTTYECENKCMPPSICSITGEQCTADIECCGCNPYAKRIQAKIREEHESKVEQGSKVEGFAPKYSPPPRSFNGVDMWTYAFNKGMNYYEKTFNPIYQPKHRYNQNQLIGKVQYPERATLSGQFIENGAYTLQEGY